MKRIALALILGSAGGTHALADDNHRPIDEPTCVQIIGRISKLPLVKLDRYEVQRRRCDFQASADRDLFQMRRPV